MRFSLYPSGICFYTTGNPGKIDFFGGDGRESPVAIGKVQIRKVDTNSLKSIVLICEILETYDFARRLCRRWKEYHHRCGLKPIVREHTVSDKKLLIFPFHAVLEFGFPEERVSCRMKCLSLSEAVRFLRRM